VLAKPTAVTEPHSRSQRLTNPVTQDDVLDEQPAPRPRRRGFALILAGAVIAGGITVAVIQLTSSGSQTAANDPAPAPAPDPGSGSGSAVAVAVADPVADARAALAELLHGESDRVKRIAAEALARTGDDGAITTLAALLASETSDITKLEIAYALARAGDVRGMTVLTASAKSGRRDVRADAGRMLVLLGDPNGDGAKALGNFVDLRNHRLGAAEALARIADPKAIAALTAIHADEDAAADDRVRAAIALGRAKQPAVEAELVGLLPDGRFNAFAAAALADLKNPAGRPVLAKQLDVPSLRVGAALALRRLEPELDPAPLLAPLTAALASDKDVARVTAAEAILILAGPVAWSERD
jgi:hypothetical protein